MTLAGRVFAYGEEVPTASLKPTSIEALVRARRIALVDDNGQVTVPPPTPRSVVLPAHRKRT